MSQDTLAERMHRLGIRDVDLEETFARSSGPPKRKQSCDRCNAASQGERHQRDCAGFALASGEPQAGAGTSTGCDRERSRKKARGRDREARKRAAKKIATTSGTKAKNSGIETQARRVKETPREGRNLTRILRLKYVWRRDLRRIVF
jgi:hypothetical protein